ncbi:MAG: DUF481 domain-containing protein [Opitutales bacterium]|nr:DUF481 domain-containing protein [Opitutales bacterium]
MNLSSFRSPLVLRTQNAATRILIGAVVSVLVAGFVQKADAAELKLKTGEILIGEWVDVQSDQVVFRSDGLGELRLNRALVVEVPSLVPAKVGESVEERGTDTASAEVEVPLLNRWSGLPGELSLNYKVGIERINNQNEVDTLRAAVEASWKIGLNELSTYHSIAQGEVDGNKILDQRNHSLRYIRDINERWRWLNQYDWFYDGLSLIDSQWQVASVPAYYFVKKENLTLLAGVGLGYQSTEYHEMASILAAGDPEFESKRDGWALVGYQLLRYQINPTLELKQVFLGYPMLDGDQYAANLAVSLAHSITPRLGLVLQYQTTYNSKPAPTVPEFVDSLEIMLRHSL